MSCSCCSSYPSTESASAGISSSQPQHAMLEAAIPGFTAVSAVVLKYTKIDLNIYVPLIILVSGLAWAWSFLSRHIWHLVRQYLMSTIEVRPDDEVFNMLMAWVYNHEFSRTSRNSYATTSIRSRSRFLMRWGDNEYEDDDNQQSQLDGNKRIMYTPSLGKHYFFHKGRPCIFNRILRGGQQSWLPSGETEEISISCFGRNPSLLKEILLKAREDFARQADNKTLIYRGMPDGESSRLCWQRTMVKLSRPLSTVIMKEKDKKALVEDMQSHLCPKSKQWYSNRGIPYNRGYLLHGPPGTGKSSLSLALAGFFKLRIYIVSLNNILSTEENLAMLFAELPRNCMVLLEDIDAAGLTHIRERDNNHNQYDNSFRIQAKNTRGSSSISLSGLLNILDGVAAQEDRILIMTTNHLEKLDEVLIRPGRIDKITELGLADPEMISSLFRSVYLPSTNETAPLLCGTSTENTQDSEKMKEPVIPSKCQLDETRTEIQRLAKEFVEKVPADEFSPAELLNYLLKHKTDPQKAFDGANEWAVTLRKEKAAREHLEHLGIEKDSQSYGQLRSH